MDIATDALPELFSQAGRDYETTGYEQCWYPFAKSEDVKSGAIIGLEDSTGSARVDRLGTCVVGGDGR